MPLHAIRDEADHQCLVVEIALVILGKEVLRECATRREIGKGGGWGFGGENSTPIEAAGLALLGLTTSKRNPKRKAKVT